LYCAKLANPSDNGADKWDAFSQKKNSKLHVTLLLLYQGWHDWVN
jgi:hypothetical protein